MTFEEAVEHHNRGMIAFDLFLGTGAIAAPDATLRVLGHADPVRRCPRAVSPQRARLAHLRRGARRGRCPPAPGGLDALAWLRGTELLHRRAVVPLPRLRARAEGGDGRGRPRPCRPRLRRTRPLGPFAWPAAAMILLTGATGTIGGAAAAPAVAARTPVRCLVRDPRRLGAERVRVQIALGDLADPASFRNALRGVTP